MASLRLARRRGRSLSSEAEHSISQSSSFPVMIRPSHERSRAALYATTYSSNMVYSLERWDEIVSSSCSIETPPHGLHLTSPASRLSSTEREPTGTIRRPCLPLQRIFGEPSKNMESVSDL